MATITKTLLLLIPVMVQGTTGPLLRKVSDTKTTTVGNALNNELLRDKMRMLKEGENLWLRLHGGDLSMSFSMMPVGGPTAPSPAMSFSPFLTPQPSVLASPTRVTPSVTTKPSVAGSPSAMAPSAPSAPTSPMFPSLPHDDDSLTTFAPVTLPPAAVVSPTAFAPVVPLPTLIIPQVQPSLMSNPTLGKPSVLSPTGMKGATGKSGLAGGAIAGIVLASIAIVVAGAAMVWNHKKKGRILRGN